MMGTIANKIWGAQDKDGMLRRALERIIQLYTDKSHFVYELLQNAEDAAATQIKFIQYEDRLEVLHDGKPFTPENLQGLCDIGKSDKVDNLNQIGEFGVGFKSVFSICKTVKLYSTPQNYYGKVEHSMDPFAVEILDFTRPKDIEYEELKDNYTTRFVLPYNVGNTFSGFKTFDDLNTVLSEKLQNLGITTLLFMKSLKLIEYKIFVKENKSGRYSLKTKNISKSCCLVSAIGQSSNEDEAISYLKFSRNIGKIGNRSVDIAFPVVKTADGDFACQRTSYPYVSVYFPTETESKLDFIVQGPYRTTPNRSSIPQDDPENIGLAKETAILLKESIIELKRLRIFNLSFLNIMPINEAKFENSKLFLPLYEATKNIFEKEAIIPCKSGKYVKAKNARIARQEKLIELLPDALLSDLINDGCDYHWLSTYFTETNREYENAYRFLILVIKVVVIRPSDLRFLFANNPHFLTLRDNEWLVKLYQILSNVGAAFSKAKNESNMLTSEIIKTSKGTFVAPYRKSEQGSFIRNVFLPSARINSDDINFVNEELYDRCKNFFDDILDLQQPDEYEFLISNIKKRYCGECSPQEEIHISDLKFLLKYLKFEGCSSEVKEVIENYFSLKCEDGQFRKPYLYTIYSPKTKTGINIESYYENIPGDRYFLDLDFYLDNDISIEELNEIGVKNSIMIGESVTQGIYRTTRGGQPVWNAQGKFRWKLSIDSINEVLRYISIHPFAKDSILKSQVIFKLLFENESKLVGYVNINGVTPNLENEPCTFLKILNAVNDNGWDGKWLYSESGELISPQSVSKYGISSAIYGPIQKESMVYDYLGFRKTEADEVDELKKNIPKKKLDAFFESELKERYNITPVVLNELIYSTDETQSSVDDECDYSFPIAKVKNWDTLKKHAAEMLVYANPVKYENVIRRTRTSYNTNEIKSYLYSMYRYPGTNKYACQMCHKPFISVEYAELFKTPETELDPNNILVCPNCGTKYRKLRNDKHLMEGIKTQIIEMSEKDVIAEEQVAISIEENELWFTQVHFAEIQELLRLEQSIKSSNIDFEEVLNRKDTKEEKNEVNIKEEDEHSPFECFIGEKIIRKKDGFSGIIEAVDEKYIYVKQTGKEADNPVKIQLKFFVESVTSKNGVYLIVE